MEKGFVLLTSNPSGEVRRVVFPTREEAENAQCLALYGVSKEMCRQLQANADGRGGVSVSYSPEKGEWVQMMPWGEVKIRHRYHPSVAEIYPEP